MLHAYLGNNAFVMHDALFQLNCFQLESVSLGSIVETEDKDRLWIQAARIFYYSGSMDVSIKEKVVFQSADLNVGSEERQFSKDSFLKVHADGSV